MSGSRQTKKERKNKSRAARRKLMLKSQSFKPVLRSVDLEKIKKEFRKGSLAEKETAASKPLEKK